ncbi:outer membrane lipoprotein carrier protein LolA [Verrucomicrobia bacterium]|nr:outer membrane lipoprotein carrier protein LolA [Verrucomicrobiota bacterium]
MFGKCEQIQTLEELQATLSKQKVIRGFFRQIRKLGIFSQPLVSQGSFLLAKDYGLQWTQDKPFSLLLVLGSDRLSQQFTDQPAEVIKAEENPMMFHFSQLFLSIFRGEIKGLDEQFEIKFVPDETWSLELKPKKEPLSTVFNAINLRGGSYIDYIRLVETSGDVSEIYFTAQQNEPAILTGTERRAFDL